MFPSLRLGFYLAPPPLVPILPARSRARFLQGVPSSIQAVLAEFIEEGHFATHLRRMRDIYRERHDALCAAARHQLDGLLDVVPSQSGLHTIGHLRAGLAELAVADAARARDITVSPIGRYALAPTPARGLVLGFGGIRPPEIESGVTVLRDVLEQQVRQQARQPVQEPEPRPARPRATAAVRWS